jgi:hypothetical protein
MPENHVEQMTEDRKKQIEEFFAKIPVAPYRLSSIVWPPQREEEQQVDVEETNYYYSVR